MNKSIIKDNGFECTQCKKIVLDRHKHDNEEDICDQCKIENLEKQLAITEEALELACETIKQMCGRPLWIGGNIPSPEPKDSEYFKDIAKEMLENEKRI